MNKLASPPWWHTVLALFRGLDLWLLAAAGLLAGLGLLAMFSAGFDFEMRFADHARNMLLALLILFTVAQVPPQRLAQLALPIYTVGVLLLVATALFGITKKGSTRWLNLGVVIQPSELMKLAMPLMLAWWFQRREGGSRAWAMAGGALLLLLPSALVARQPDLGTAILVFSGGFYVMFFAGFPWRLLLPVMVAGLLGIAVLVWQSDALCQPGVDWVVLKEYQRHRVCTLLDPMQDPLGKGFHIIQGMIAIGSGGLTGKGFMAGTQTHLEFIPERTTDFIFAAYAEEFGLIGTLALVLAFALLIWRGLVIALQAPTQFTRLLAGAISMSFFTYAMVNMGMVSGILPVVGVPLPFVSYGGTAMVTLGVALGMLMSVSKSRRLMQS